MYMILFIFQKFQYFHQMGLLFLTVTEFYYQAQLFIFQEMAVDLTTQKITSFFCLIFKMIRKHKIHLFLKIFRVEYTVPLFLERRVTLLYLSQQVTQQRQSSF